MAVFSRRSIQGFINKLAATAPNSDIERFVHRLNQNDQQSIACEWEVAILSALHQLGRVLYEQRYEGSRTADVSFFATRETQVPDFIAEVACVSDAGLENANPTRALSDFLREKALQFGLSPGAFTSRIAGELTGSSARRKMQLALPPGSRIREHLEKIVAPELELIARRKLHAHSFEINDEELRAVISYQRNARYSSMSYPSYTAPYSLTRNPLFMALDIKADQLKDTGFDGCMGIFLCDGGCESLGARMKTHSTFSASDIVGDFLRQHKHASFAVIVWVSEESPIIPWPLQSSLKLQVAIFRNREALVPLSPAAEFQLQKLRNNGAFPQPVDTGTRAASRALEGRLKIGLSFEGGYTMGFGSESGILKMSARELMEILAGMSSRRDIAPRGDSDSRLSLSAAMARALLDGRMIKSIEVERCEHEDDDWVVFRFSGPDPAISKFRVPSRSV